MSDLSLDYDQFEELVDRYFEKAGQHSLTTYGLYHTPYRDEAIRQIQAYLNGSRAALVTDESIGMKGEGLLD